MAWINLPNGGLSSRSSKSSSEEGEAWAERIMAEIKAELAAESSPIAAAEATLPDPVTIHRSDDDEVALASGVAAPANSETLAYKQPTGAGDRASSIVAIASVTAPEAAVVAKGVKARPADVVALASPATDVTRFPVHDVHTVKEFDDTQRAMADLCRRILLHNDYLRERDAYCHLSICLNLIGKQAPAFRPKWKVEAPLGSEVFHQINRDQVVIDLHWCHTTKMPLMPEDARYAALLRADVDFSFDGAWTIALTKQRNIYRAVEALCLTTLQQCQLLKLRSPELVARFKSLGSGWRDSGGKSAGKLAEATRHISQWAERDKRIEPRRDEYKMLWLALELLGCDTSNQQIAVLHALMMGGEVKDRTSIRDMRKKLDKHVPVTPKAE